MLTNELPELLFIMFNKCSAFIPACFPIVSASASATPFWKTTMLFKILAIWPQPAGPQWVTSGPIHRRTSIY